MSKLVIETDIGRDADDFFALLYFLGRGEDLEAICVSPGDYDQVAIVKALLKCFGLDTPVFTPANRINKPSISSYHKWLISEMGGKGEMEPDGHEEAITKEPVELFVCGPAKMAHLFKPTKITFQGGFVPYALYRPKITLDKFEGLTACPTFNLGGTKSNVRDILLNAPVEHRWVGKNICHSVVYTPEVHSLCPRGGPTALQLHRKAVERYISEKGAKAFHDPLAALLSRNVDLGIWLQAKPAMIRKGEWAAIPTTEEQYSLVELTDSPWQEYFKGLSGK